MQNSTYNELKLKKQLAPADYRPDQYCQIKHPKTGKMVSIPVVLVQALRNGEVKIL